MHLPREEAPTGTRQLLLLIRTTIPTGTDSTLPMAGRYGCPSVVVGRWKEESAGSPRTLIVGKCNSPARVQTRYADEEANQWAAARSTCQVGGQQAGRLARGR